MPRNLDTALVRSFLAVVDAGGVTRAAQQLHVTQAAVSQHLRRLEETLGCGLFVREHRRLTLSAAGERLLPRARALVALNDEIWSLMTAPEFAGEVRLGVPHDIVAHLLPPVLRRFDADHPRIQVTLVCATSQELLRLLEQGEVDLCLTTERGHGPGGERLGVDPLVWVTGRGGRAWQRDPVPVGLGDERCAFRPAVLAALAEAGRDWRLAGSSGDVTALYALVEADIVVSAMLASTVPATCELVPAGKLPPLPPFDINLYLPAAGTSTAAREMARYLRQRLNTVQARAA